MKILVTSLLIFLSVTVSAQLVDRQKVIVEVSTGTWCPSCPTVVNLLEDLKATGAEITVLKYHIGDSYENLSSGTRDLFYNFQWFPTTYYDGTRVSISDWATYSVHEGLYLNRIATQSNFTISMTYQFEEGATSIEGEILLEELETYPGNDLRLHIVLTESEIPEEWQGETQLDQVVRMMNEFGAGAIVDLSSSSTLSFPFSFDLDPEWNTEHLEITYFIQDHTSKEILQGDFSEVENTVLGVPESEVVFTSTIVPNPATNEIRLLVDQNQRINDIQIIDILGKQVSAIKDYQGTIDVSSLAQGMYLLSYTVNGSLQVEKFIKE